MSESTGSNSDAKRSPANNFAAAEDKRTSSSSFRSPLPSNELLTSKSMVMKDDSTDPSETAASDKDGEKTATAEDGSAQQPSDEGGAAEQAPKGSAADTESTDTSEEGGGTGEKNEQQPSSEDETGSEEASTTEAAPTSDLNSETESTPSSALKDPGKMVSRALEYDLQDMYPEISLLFEDKQSAWNCQDPATIRAIWLESRTNILREWKMRNGRIHAKEKPKLEVKPNMTMTLRKQFTIDKAKQIDWRDMYIPPGNNAPKYAPLTLPTNKVTEVRYNFNRNNPPVPSIYVRHYEKYRRPPFNVFQPHQCDLIPHVHHL